VNFSHSVKPKLKGLKVGRREMLRFVGLIVINIWLFVIGSPVAWNRQWKKVLAAIVLAALLEILIQVAWDVVPALWQTFRKERFIGYFKILIFGTLATAVWGLCFVHYCYLTASHFKLMVTCRPCIIANMYDYDGVRSTYPVASVFFSDLTLFNKYAPAKPHDWKLIATLPTGEELVGFPSDKSVVFSDPESVVGKDSFIWGTPVTQFDFLGGIGNGNTIDAPADFIFPGVRENDLLAPGVILTIEVKGRNDTAQVIAPSHLIEARPPQKSRPPGVS
jgi:hypothetical protein